MMSVHLEMEGLLNNPGSLMVSSQGYSVVGGGQVTVFIISPMEPPVGRN